MMAVKLYILPGLMVFCGLLPAALLGRSWMLRRKPLMFAQATVVALGEHTASFELFDGQTLELILDRDAVVHVGDYGRLTYRADRFVSLER